NFVLDDIVQEFPDSFFSFCAQLVSSGLGLVKPFLDRLARLLLGLLLPLSVTQALLQHIFRHSIRPKTGADKGQGDGDEAEEQASRREDIDLSPQIIFLGRNAWAVMKP